MSRGLGPGRKHGTKACYVFGPEPGQDRSRGCRCEECRAAARKYENRRLRMKTYGRWRPFVDAGPAQVHLRELSALGVGQNQIENVSGVGHTAQWKIRSGRVRRIRPETERAILAVSWRDRAEGYRVPAARTWSLIETLLRAGYTKVSIAEQIGQRTALQLGRRFVTVRHARTIQGFYDRLFREDVRVRDAETDAHLRFPRRIRDRWHRHAEVAV